MAGGPVRRARGDRQPADRQLLRPRHLQRHRGRRLDDPLGQRRLRLRRHAGDRRHAAGGPGEGPARLAPGVRPGQRAVALDFAANVAAGLQILQDEVEPDPRGRAEHQQRRLRRRSRTGSSRCGRTTPASTRSRRPATNDGAWGVGWANNPANPKYPANRGSFLETRLHRRLRRRRAPAGLAVPGEGDGLGRAPGRGAGGARTRWSSATARRGGTATRSPVRATATTSSRRTTCSATPATTASSAATWTPDDPEVIGEPAGPCAHRNAAGPVRPQVLVPPAGALEAGLRATPAATSCCGSIPGTPTRRTARRTRPAATCPACPPARGSSTTCPSSMPSVRPNCPRTANAGTFSFTFNAEPGRPVSREDRHAPARRWASAATSGCPTPGRPPPTAARSRSPAGGASTSHSAGWRRSTSICRSCSNGTTQARYLVKTRYGDRQSVVRQQGNGNRWVPIGTFHVQRRARDQPQLASRTTATARNGSPGTRSRWCPPTTAIRTLKVLNWNIAGAADNDGDFMVVDRLVTEVLDRPPDVITLNEVCREQFDYLTERLAAVGLAHARPLRGRGGHQFRRATTTARMRGAAGRQRGASCAARSAGSRTSFSTPTTN